MTEADVTTIRRAYAAFARGNIPGLLAVLAADVAWYHPDELPYGGRFRGPAEVVQLLGQVARTFDELLVEVTDVLAAGTDRVLATGCEHVRVRGASADVGFAHVWTVRGGKVTAFRAYTDSGKLLALFSRLATISQHEPLRDT
jgi:uncharacterized protein